jgi:hypothetical protein
MRVFHETVLLRLGKTDERAVDKTLQHAPARDCSSQKVVKRIAPVLGSADTGWPLCSPKSDRFDRGLSKNALRPLLGKTRFPTSFAGPEMLQRKEQKMIDKSKAIGRFLAGAIALGLMCPNGASAIPVAQPDRLQHAESAATPVFWRGGWRPGWGWRRGWGPSWGFYPAWGPWGPGYYRYGWGWRRNWCYWHPRACGWW